MRTLLARLAVVGALAVTMTACSNGNGNSLPFGGPPNNAGGSPGTVQAGSNGLSLIRFVQGSPDTADKGGGVGVVDVCIDNLPMQAQGVLNPAVPYGFASGLYSIPGGITHTISVYPGLGTPTSSNGGAGAECPTAPGPYFFNAPIKVTTLSPGVPSRLTVVLGGTAASGTVGLFVFTEQLFPTSPAGPAVIAHNAAPQFSKGKSGVGFGYCTTTVTPCKDAVALTGQQNLAAPKASTVGATVPNITSQTSIAGVPAGFYDGAGVPAGPPVPIASIAAPNPVAGQPYVVELYAVDAIAGGLNLVGFVEQTLGYGF